MSKCYNFLVPLVVYPFDIMFSVGETDRQFKESVESVLKPSYARIFLEDDLLPSMSERCNGRTVHSLVGYQTVVRFKSVPISNYELGTLSHEIFHAVDLIFRTIGLKLSDTSDEAYAYAIGYITEQFWNNIKPTK